MWSDDNKCAKCGAYSGGATLCKRCEKEKVEKDKKKKKPKKVKQENQIYIYGDSELYIDNVFICYLLAGSVVKTCLKGERD